jgi:methyl-accepting chemotaxis protein
MKITLGKKLFASFLAIVLIMVVSGWIGITAMGKINKANTEITGHWLMRVNMANQFNDLTQKLIATELKGVLESNPQQMQSYENETGKIIAQFNQQIEQYGKHLAGQEDTSNYNALKIAWNNYLPVHDKIIAFTKKADVYKGLGIDAAELSSLMQISGNLSADIQRYVDRIVELNKEGIQQAALQADNSYQDAKTGTLIAIVASLALTLTLAYFITSGISRPVRTVSQALRLVSEGDLTIREIKIKNKDEVGMLVTSLNQMVRDLRAIVNQVKDATMQVAASSEELTASAEQTAEAAQEIAMTTQKVALGSEQQLRSVGEAAQVVQQMSSGIRHIADNSREVSHLAENAANASTEGQAAVKAVVHQMGDINTTVSETETVIKRLGARSSEIGEVVHLITNIAKQTNLLALNAAIEAARAGEMGKGFAVVAHEVRKLAEQSAGSANQIRELLAGIQKETENAVHSMQKGTAKVADGLLKSHQADQAFQAITYAVSNTADKMREVSSAIQQIAAGSDQIVKVMDGVKQTTEEGASSSQQNAATSQEQLATMEEITSSAQSLSDLAEDLQLVLSRFKL